MKKKMIICLIFFIHFILTISLAKANFVCGEVESNSQIIPSWTNINIYYSEKPVNFTSCKVSPDDFKYCCDPLDIKAVNWQIGKTINANVFDIENGYFSNSTSLVISGEGFDVFPKIYLEKGIQINSPNKKAYINNNSIILNISSASIFNKLYYNLTFESYSNSSLLCDNCNQNYLFLDNLPFGEYLLKVDASNSAVNYSEYFNFSLLDYIDFNRSFSCEGCSSTRIKSGKQINVTLLINLSHYSSGRIVEYIPVDFELLSDQIIEPYSDTHNMISFDVAGKDIMVNYTLMAPNDFFSRDYIFQGSFEDIFSEEQEMTASSFWLFDFFSILKKISRIDKNLSETKKFLKVNPNEPLVYEPKSDYIQQLVIFTRNYNKNVLFRFNERFFPSYAEDILPTNAKFFSFKSNINEEKVTKVSFKFKLSNEEFSTPYFYSVNYRNFTKLDYEKYLDDGNFSYYYVEGKKPGFYLVSEEMIDE